MNAPAASELVLLSSTGRDGGTLLLRLLDGSPELWVHPIDVVYLTAWDDLATLGTISSPTMMHARTGRLDSLERRLPRSMLLGTFGRHWHDIDEEYVPLLERPLDGVPNPEGLLPHDADYGVREFLPAFLDATRRAYDGRSAPTTKTVFKMVETPYIDEYLRLFPDMRCIHLVRDPVTNWASLKRSWSYHQARSFYHGGYDILRTFLDARWLPHAEAAVRLTETGPGRHRIVRYEDLTHDAAGTVGGLCAWLGAPPPDDCERLTSLGGRAMTAMPPDPRPSHAGIATPGRVVSDMASRFEYDDVVTPRERELLAALTGPLARRLGYYPEWQDGVGARLRLAVRWLPPDATERRHIHSRLRWAWEIARRRAYVARRLLSARVART